MDLDRNKTEMEKHSHDLDFVHPDQFKSGMEKQTPDPNLFDQDQFGTEEEKQDPDSRSSDPAGPADQQVSVGGLTGKKRFITRPKTRRRVWRVRVSPVQTGFR